MFDAMLFSVAKWQIKSSHPNRSSLLRMLASGCGRGVSRKSMKITYDKEADALDGNLQVRVPDDGVADGTLAEDCDAEE